jgi:hypothetical protein
MKQFILAALLVTGISSVKAQMKFGASFFLLQNDFLLHLDTG